MIKQGKYSDMTGRFKSKIVALNENLWKEVVCDNWITQPWMHY